MSGGREEALRLTEELARLREKDRLAGRWVRRSWRERLLQRPWRPWVRERWEEPFSKRRLEIAQYLAFRDLAARLEQPSPLGEVLSGMEGRAMRFPTTIEREEA